MLKYIALAASATGLLTACTSGGPKVSAEQCIAADWYQVGLAAGQKGANITEFNTVLHACAEHGIDVDKAQWEAGRLEGLKTFCQTPSLLEATLQGAGDPMSCQPFSDAQQSAFETGRDTRAAAMRYQQLKAQYDQLVQTRDQINQEGSQLTQRYQQTTDEAVKQQIAARINQLKQQLAQVNAQLKEADPVMQTESQTYQAAVEKYEAFKAGLAQ